MNEGVHVTHCCGRHGCKYGDHLCPVALGRLTQEYPCEFSPSIAEATRAVNDAQEELDWVWTLARRGKNLA